MERAVGSLLLRPLHDLRDALDVLRADLARLRLQRRPADGQPHHVEAQRADLGHVVAAEGVGRLVPLAAAGLDDKIFDRQIAIIQSMTPKERSNPDLLKHSRKKRIAAGSGTNAAEINKLLKMHRQMADMMKSMKGKKGGGMMGKMMGGLAGKMGLPGGMGGMGGMPDLSKMSPQELEALQKQAQAAGLGGGGMPKLPGLGGGPALPGLGGGAGLPGLPKKK